MIQESKIPENKTVSKMIKQGLYDDLAVLVENELVNDPDYFIIGAMPGGTCEGSNVRNLIRNFAKYVRETQNKK